MYAWRWSDEDQEAYERLKSKVGVKVKLIPAEGSFNKHVFWPVTVFDIEEVWSEVEKIRNGILFSPDDPRDVELINKYRESSNLEEYVRRKYGEELEGKGSGEVMKYIVIEADRFIRERTVKLCNMLVKAREATGSTFWFSFYNPG